MEEEGGEENGRLPSRQMGKQMRKNIGGSSEGSRQSSRKKNQNKLGARSLLGRRLSHECEKNRPLSWGKDSVVGTLHEGSSKQKTVRK